MVFPARGQFWLNDLSSSVFFKCWVLNNTWKEEALIPSSNGWSAGNSFEAPFPLHLASPVSFTKKLYRTVGRKWPLNIAVWEI